ncbi:unnamed protein product, partial [Rodentolepis nana]|uniref:hydroxymethylglutaryl-CoA reductase (NADPH) n=1 Tax=Rodentolepis nana TaxID=102285 RepID=A0A0R3TIW2_RODNA
MRRLGNCRVGNCLRYWLCNDSTASSGWRPCLSHQYSPLARMDFKFNPVSQSPLVVDSSACMTQLEAEPDGSLYVSVTMPCIEVGTVGGGTRLPAQRGCLDMLDLQVERPSEHLARLIAGVVLAGEISLLAALATNDLVQAHMQLNRAAVAVAVATAG